MRLDAELRGMKGVELHQRAADAEHVKAVASLGGMYVAGRGVVRDEVKALGLFRRAAEGGLVEATLNLGLMYNQSCGGGEGRWKGS